MPLTFAQANIGRIRGAGWTDWDFRPDGQKSVIAMVCLRWWADLLHFPGGAAGKCNSRGHADFSWGEMLICVSTERANRSDLPPPPQHNHIVE